MKKIVFVYIALVLIVIVLAVWRLGAFSFLGGLGGGDTAEVTIDDTTVEVEVADDDEERIAGLSGRDGLDEGRGMLFVFEEKSEQTFWMYQMRFPIDIIFIDDETIVSIESDVQPPAEEDPNRAELPRYSSEVPINYVLEVPAGYSEAQGWEVGDTVEISGL